MKSKKLLILLFGVLSALIFLKIYVTQELAKPQIFNIGSPENGPNGASAELKAFQSIQKKMSLEQVEALVGRPDRRTGSGVDIHVYVLEDESEVWLGWAGTNLIYVVYKNMNLLTGAEIPNSRP